MHISPLISQNLMSPNFLASSRQISVRSRDSTFVPREDVKWTRTKAFLEVSVTSFE